MNSNRFYTLIICCILAATLLSSCVDNVDVGEQGFDTSKLVLYCRLCPQMDSTYILLTSSHLVFGHDNQNHPIIDDGTVELSADGSHWVRADFDSSRMRYLVTKEVFPVEEGGTYYIRASYPGFEDVSATCTVPRTHDVGFHFDTVATDGDLHWGEPYNWPHNDVYVEWRDVFGEENAYAVGYRRLQPIEHYYDQYEYDIIYEWRFDLEWLTEGNKELLCVSDKGHDGEVMRYLWDIYDEDDWESDVEPIDAQRYLLFLDKNCYQYEMTLPVIDGMNMLGFLFLEPEHTYNNIRNGFGLFGAFSLLPVGN